MHEKIEVARYAEWMDVLYMTAAYQDDDIDTDEDASVALHVDTDEKEVDNDMAQNDDDEMMIHVKVHMSFDDDERHCTAAYYVHDE